MPRTPARRLKVLVCGGGVAGPSLAYWLARSGHRVTIIERFPTLRATGAQVDLRGLGIEAARRMGILEAIRDKLVDEPGVAFVDASGKARATILANTTGQGSQSLTSEYEIMRGDLVRILYDATKGDVRYDFGKTVLYFKQDEQRVVAHFSDGSCDEFDLLVGADGQSSQIRNAIRPEISPDPYLRIGLHMAYWFVRRIASDSNIRETYNATGGRMIMRRSHNSTETQVYFVLRGDSNEASAIHRMPVAEQKEFWAKTFQTAGWQTDRFISGMMVADFFYSQEVVQVRTDTWSQGRVVLVGDAAHCASPYSGMGVSGSLVGAYVLAREIDRNSDNLPLAFARYDSELRPFVAKIQKLKPFLLRLGLPKSQRGVNALHIIAASACFLRLPELVARLSRGANDGGPFKQRHRRSARNRILACI